MPMISSSGERLLALWLNEKAEILAALGVNFGFSERLVGRESGGGGGLGDTGVACRRPGCAGPTRYTAVCREARYGELRPGK